MLPFPGNAIPGDDVSSSLFFHLLIESTLIPRLFAACVKLYPLAVTSFTASTLNSSLYLFLVFGFICNSFLFVFILSELLNFYSCFRGSLHLGYGKYLSLKKFINNTLLTLLKQLSLKISRVCQHKTY